MHRYNFTLLIIFIPTIPSTFATSILFHFFFYFSFVQLDHFLGELEEIFDTTLNTTSSSKVKKLKLDDENKLINNKNTAKMKNFTMKKFDGRNDRGWQSVAVSRCLWGCENSPIMTMESIE